MEEQFYHRLHVCVLLQEVIFNLTLNLLFECILDFCVAYDGETPIIEIRKFLRGEPQVEEEAEFVEAMGFTVTNFFRYIHF